jgi:hypothetical protein
MSEIRHQNPQIMFSTEKSCLSLAAILDKKQRLLENETALIFLQYIISLLKKTYLQSVAYYTI